MTEYGLHNRNFYVQDSYTRDRMTVNFGIRFDHQSDFANANTAPASPFFGKATYTGVYNNVTYSGATFNQLPALAFPGAEHRHHLQELVAAHRLHLRPAW